MMLIRSVIGFSLALVCASALAGESVSLKEKLVEKLSSTSTADVMECLKSGEGTLSVLNSMSAEPSEIKTKVELQTAVWRALSDARNEDDRIAAEAILVERRLARKKELESMSGLQAAVFMAKRPNPCREMMEKAEASIGEAG